MDSSSEKSDASDDENDSWEPKMKKSDTLLKWQLRNNLTLTFLPEKPSTVPRLWCKYCYEGFRYMARLNQHMAVHTAERPYECSKCAARFKHVSSLNSHQRRHDKIKEFKCAKCDKTFSQRSELTKHGVEHMVRSGTETRTIEVEDAAEYECRKCAVTFGNSVDLVLHRRTMEHVRKWFAKSF